MTSNDFDLVHAARTEDLDDALDELGPGVDIDITNDGDEFIVAFDGNVPGDS